MTEHEDEKVDGLDGLYAEHAPPAALEESIFDELVARGELSAKPAHAGRNFLPWAPRGMGRIAAGFALLTLGWAGGRYTVPPSASSQSGPSFMMLLWEDENFETNDSVEQIAAEYSAWATDVSTSGAITTGNELGPTRFYAGRPQLEDEADRAASAVDESAPTTPDGGSVAAPLLGGYFVVSAADRATVQALADAHPHVRNGGWIEIAPIVTR